VYLFVLSYLAAAGFWFTYLSDIYLTRTLKNCSFFCWYEYCDVFNFRRI